MTAGALVEADGISKAYRGKTGLVDVLRGVSFALAAGEIVGLLGENGSGKTTLVKTVSGIVTRDAGTVAICGSDPQRNRSGAARHIGAVFPGGRNVYWRMTPAENLRYFAQLRGVALGADVLDHGLAVLELEAVRDTELRKLSTGYKQRVAVACAAIHQPQVLFFDEPTLGLDRQSSTLLCAWLRNLAREAGCAVLVTSHDSAFIEGICDRVMVIRGGALRFAGRTEALRHQLRDRRTFALSVSAATPDLRALLGARGAVETDLDPGQAQFAFHQPDGRFLGEVVPLISSHGASLLDVTVHQRSLGELLDGVRDD